MDAETILGTVSPLSRERESVPFRLHDIDLDVGELLEPGSVHSTTSCCNKRYARALMCQASRVCGCLDAPLG
jgi:hypothetical protein